MTKINNRKSGKNKQEKDTLIDLKCFSIEQLFEKAVDAYKKHDVTKNDTWNIKMAESGTKKDKVTAVSALILENPENSLRYFDTLIKWTSDENHNFALKACEVLSNIYSDHIFVEKSFLNIFLDSVQSRIRKSKKKTEIQEAELIGYYIEHEIKEIYRQFIRNLQTLLQSTLTHVKKGIIKILGKLARFKQLRRMILSLIINKFGDHDMDIVNQTSKCLKTEFYQDLLASQTLLEETQRFLFRLNLSNKSQFYVINFLNNINLKFLNEKSLNRLFQIFYHFFTKFMQSSQNSEDIGSRLFLNSIKGLNRLFSFMKGGNKETKLTIQSKIQAVYKVVHTTPNIKAKIQLLLFLFQTHSYLHDGLSDRYFRSLYDFLLNNDILHCSLTQIFFDLILVSLKADQNLLRVMAMIKRLLQLCFQSSTNFLITCLIMIEKVLQDNEGLKALIRQRQNVMEEEEGEEGYDMFKREPKYSNADRTCLWELRIFANHFHPSVRKFSKSIIENNFIQYSGSNPLLQYSLTSFVEKFSLKKEKKSEAWKMKVRRNLPKIRPSKYETLLTKSLQNFDEDEEFIKKYLQKRSSIHKNYKKMQQIKDIQQFADEVVEKEIDRLNPKEDDFSHSYSDISENQQDYSDLILEDEDMEEQEVDNEYGDEMEESEESEEISDEKDFDEAFDEISEEQSFPKKQKKIGKVGKGGKARNGGKDKKRWNKKR